MTCMHSKQFSLEKFFETEYRVAGSALSAQTTWAGMENEWKEFDDKRRRRRRRRRMMRRMVMRMV